MTSSSRFQRLCVCILLFSVTILQLPVEAGRQQWQGSREAKQRGRRTGSSPQPRHGQESRRAFGLSRHDSAIKCPAPLHRQSGTLHEGAPPNTVFKQGSPTQQADGAPQPFSGGVISTSGDQAPNMSAEGAARTSSNQSQVSLPTQALQTAQPAGATTGANQSTTPQTPSAAGAGAGAGAAPPTLVPSSARIFAAPALQANKAAWMSIYDADGAIKAGERVAINGAVVASDECGIVSFIVPGADKLHICIIDNSGRETTARLDYTSRSGELLLQESSIGSAFEKLEELSTTETGPRVIYAPPVVDKLSSFLVVGKNFSGVSGKDRLSVDGRDADIFAGSAVCLLARAAEKTSLGPLKEMFVMADGEASNSREMDICRIDSMRRDADDGHASQLRVTICGTNMPCIIELSPGDKARLRLKGRSVNGMATVVSPGGDRNHVDFEIEGATTSPLTAVLLADQLLEPSLAARDNLQRIAIELNKAQASRLQRRYIALDLRLSETQSRRDYLIGTPKSDVNEIDQIQSDIRALSLRKERISKMVVAQRALIEGAGGTADDCNDAVANAEGTAGFDLEAALRPFDLFPGTVTVAKASERKRKKSRGGDDVAYRDYSFPAASDRVKAPDFKSARGKNVSELTARAPKSPHMIAPPAPYVPDIQELQSYMVASYMGPPPPLVVRQIPHSVQPAHSRTAAEGASQARTTTRKNFTAPRKVQAMQATSTSKRRKSSPGNSNATKLRRKPSKRR